MRRVMVMVFALMLLVVGVASSASVDRVADVSLSADILEVVVGSTVNLTASTTKYGNGMSDGWSGASGSTSLVGDTYVSSATFTATTVGDHSVTYSITMTSAQGNNKNTKAQLNQWNGSASVTIKVIAPPSTTSNTCGGGGQSQNVCGGQNSGGTNAPGQN